MAGRTVEAGYGQPHRKIREYWRPIVDAGEGRCSEPVCINPRGRMIVPGTPWHLAHTPDRQGYRGPAHAGCNASEAGVRGNKGRRKKPRPPKPGMSWGTSENW